MSEPVAKKSLKSREEDDTLFFQCAELVLPWLTPSELANIALTCKTLNKTSNRITLRRISDASRTFENLPIPFHHDVDDHHPPYAYFTYTPSQILPNRHQPQRQCWGSSSDSSSGSEGPTGMEMVKLVDQSGGALTGCDCEKCDESENEDSDCPCLNFVGFEDMVAECGPSCRCGLECGKRLTQKVISVRLKIVRDRKKGWSLYADQFLPSGQFICEYAGELLTTEEARKRQQAYDKLSASGALFSSALLVVREHLPSGKACLRMNIDATRIGNVARFINHSCDGGNLVTKLVRSSGSLLARLCFFASKSIERNEELTFSYGDVRLRPKGLQCFCGSSSCFGVLPSEHT